MGLPEVLEGVQLYLTGCTTGLVIYPPVIPEKNMLHQDEQASESARTATPGYLPQARFPTEGPGKPGGSVGSDRRFPGRYSPN